MHIDILNNEQKELLPFLSKYAKSYYLVGGTAIALHLGHRASIDFDLFTLKKINGTLVKKQVATAGFPSDVIVHLPDQIHFVLNNVKLTFFQFPFEVNAEIKHNNFRIPDLLTLGAMKAFALGGRGKWKDYVDLYFILKKNITTQEISQKAKEIFKDSFNPLLFLKQLSYFKDMDYQEQVEYMPGFEIDNDSIKKFLTDISLKGFF
jgi:Nucleotidyl transferase AbiEii toxin, Type IV TA system